MNTRHTGGTTVEYRIRSRISGGLTERDIGASTKALSIKRREPRSRKMRNPYHAVE